MNTKFSNYLLYAFAVIGFISILSSFNNQTQQETHGTPESHVWEFHLNVGSTNVNASPSYAINKVTGEVRKYTGTYLDIKNDGTLRGPLTAKYAVMTEAK